ncbi:MAG TPA: bacillithiol biosynthesis cysteine-adding enzyme BshC [Gemmatimonadales bacterium]|nr:bacillithiol biosynthesis cysteine-adding enzyme BshC [Gemmatimonadales bacterium]
MSRYLETPLPFPFEPLARRGAPSLAPALLEAIVPAPGIDPLVARLAQPGTMLVTTGQQPCLFLGPLYTVHKALSAARLAKALETAWRSPVVPLFWVAGDDHDFAESATAAWLNPAGELVMRELRQRDSAAPLVPMYREILGPDVLTALEALAADLPQSEFRDATVDWLRRHYRPEQTVSNAYASALAELLAPHGILCLDSTRSVVKRALAPLLIESLRRHGELDSALAAEDGRLKSRGYDAGIAVGEGASLVMLESRLGRDRLMADGAGFVTRRSGEHFSLSELERIAAAEPERLSPNVLLRPVAESAILPTVAYVGGPGELRYLKLTPPLYQSLGVPRQVPIPRWSGMVVEARVDRVLEKFGATVDELLAPPPGLEARVLKSQLPASATAALADFVAVADRSFQALGNAAHEIDPTLDRPVQNARNQALSAAHDLEKKLVSHLRKRSETELSQIVRSRTALLPGGKPQERLLSVSGYLARYGPAFLSELSAAMEPWTVRALEGAGRPA